MRFPGGAVLKNLPAMQETQGRSLGRGDPLEEGLATTPVFLPGKIPWTRGAWQAAVHGVTKNPTELNN